MESPNTEIQVTASTDGLIKPDSCSQEDRIVTLNNSFKTTNLGAASVNNTKVKIGDAITTGALESSHSIKFSIKKYYLYTCLAFVILPVLVLTVMIVLYYTNSPKDPSFFDDVDFQNCSVSL